PTPVFPDLGSDPESSPAPPRGRLLQDRHDRSVRHARRPGDTVEVTAPTPAPASASAALLPWSVIERRRADMGQEPFLLGPSLPSQRTRVFVGRAVALRRSEAEDGKIGPDGPGIAPGRPLLVPPQPPYRLPSRILCVTTILALSKDGRISTAITLV